MKNTIITVKHNGHINKLEIQGEHFESEIQQWCSNQNYTYLHHVTAPACTGYRLQNGWQVRLIK